MLLGNSNSNGEKMGSGTGGLNGGGGDGNVGGEGGAVQLKKGPWTAAEDAILSEYVRKHGEGNWNAVQRNTGLARCGKSCRLRWANHLRANLKKGAFSLEEERLIVELHAQLGNKWARMAAQLPGRTDNEIKNYWNTRVKRRQRQGQPLYPPDIQPQHQQQSSHSHHSSYHSQPSTPTTPTSSFSFPITSPTGHHYHHHHSHSLQHFPPPCYSLSPSHSLPPTPPPLSPGLQSSPHQPAYPTLTLFDTTTTTTNATPNNISGTFNMPRTPPLLQNPPRFKRFHSDTNISTFAPNNNNNNNNANANANTNTNSIINNSFNNFQGSTSYSNPYSSFFRSPSSPSLFNSPTSNCNTSSAFSSAAAASNKLFSLPSFSTLPVSFSNTNTSTLFRNTDEKNSFITSSSLSVYDMKPELPSNQYLSPNGNSAEMMAFENEKLSVSTAGSELLDDLLEQTQVGNYGESSRRVSEDKSHFSGFNQLSDSSSINLSPGLKPKEEETGGQINLHEDLSKFLNVVPSMPVPEWYTDSGEASNCQSSVVTDGNLGLEMQQLASIFRVDSTNGPGSCSYDNLPGIC